ncbi:uncharacterized protein MYCFIDRAFT_187228 [Pseudocercospora fijiensis CIRAD86]|uniref:Uncharacterized protein n=1 Tax=Pseudocercospora fijiensis (strain CIRAD86) TaxID=383855 RepID=M3B3U7_PSEFD|nr:uncharacterized protein MYCFIDRAFT_187228 [Pseudocercospora fijiensis CIRAD86]EME84063.1 hypothetical protein MYCFIDRAFT_187228 [Pseudocercospora fijiensis CIRAD86]
MPARIARFNVSNQDEEEEPQRKRPDQRRRPGQEDDLEYGSDSDGNEIVLGGLAENGDDSDLDSDEAFGESDNERFEGFTFRGSSKPKSKKKAPQRRDDAESDIDLVEEPQSEDDSGDSQDEEGLGLGDDAVDLAAMLDDNSEDEQANNRDEASGSDEEDDADDDSDSDEDEFQEFEDDEVDEEGAARLQDFLEGLDAKPGVKKSEAPQRSVVTLDDFADGTELAAENKKLKKKHQPKAMAAPLPKRQQDRIDREIAAQKAKEQLDRWRDTVVQNRRAEFLSFPLQHPDDQGITVGKDKFLPAAQQAPANELEESIQRIMQESGLQTKQDGETGADEDDVEAALLKAEGLAEKHLPVEEVERRRAELRRARDLLFREEIKAKRIAKIKSKGYRRVRRKENQRNAENERDALQGLGFEDEGEKEKHDRKRAEARMSTKHKDSKWAKSLKQTNRSAWDDEARDGVVEQARRNEELKRRIAGQDVSDDDGSPHSDDSDDDDVFNGQKLEALRADGEQKNGLAALKFMRAAEERRRKQNDEDIERIRKDLATADGEEESDVEDQSLGRAIFGPAGKESRQQTKVQRHEMEAPDDFDAGEDDGGETEHTIITEKSKARPTTNSVSKKAITSGPLAKGLPQTVANDHGAGIDWFKKAKNQSKNKSEVDADLILRSDPTNQDTQAKPSKKADLKTNGQGLTTATHNGDDASDSEAEMPSNAMTSAQLQQSAFAGDEVVAAFQAEKADLAASEDEKEVSNHLPGWGSWTGDGLSRSIKKANKRAAHNPLHKTKVAGVRQADRKDAKLENVIISEKQDRKGKKYFAPVLPHGFETREQYERSRRLPMGPEWTTKEVHQRMTKPRVIVKPGVRMEALERPTV